LRRGSYNRAKEIFLSLLMKFRAMENPPIDQFTNALWNLISSHKNIGDYQLALSYAKELETIITNSKKESFSADYAAMIYKFIAEINERLGNKRAAEENFKKSLSLVKKIPIEKKQTRNRVFYINAAYAKFLNKEGKHEQALNYLKESITGNTEQNPFIEETYRIIGNTYAEIKDTTRAISYFNKSLNSNQYDTKNFHIARTYFAYGEMYSKLNLLSKALSYYQKALTNLQDNFDDLDFCTNPENLNTVFAKKELLKVLHQKALTLFQLSKNQPDYLKCSWETIKLAIALVEDIKINNSGEYDKQFLVEESYPIFEDAIEISLAQSNQAGVDYAFEVSERSKATLLLAAVRNTQVNNFSVPDSLLDLEQQYKFELQTLAEKAYEANRLKASVLSLETEIGTLQQKLNRLNTILKTNYPNYYAFRFDTRIDGVAETQDRLPSNKAFVEYFIGKNKSYAFLITTNQDVQVFEIPTKADKLQGLIQDFLRAIYIPFIESSDSSITLLRNRYTEPYTDKIYAENGHQLYQLLLEPVLVGIKANINSLEIIPDGVLNYLPFDALLEKEVDPTLFGYYENKTDYQYLARKYQISYCYSATLMSLMQQEEKHKAVEHGVLVFDNEAFESQSTAIKTIFKASDLSDSFVNVLSTNSTKAAFETVSPTYKYLHFSVHGNINNERPNQSYLQLRPNTNGGDSLLFLKDIYKSALSAEMVFTSACNAGVGPLTKVEGLLSLARGFTYAGVNSLITTLWEIKGGPSNQIIKIFYEALNSGETKDAALTLAKQRQMNDPTYAHPYYWAGFVPIGDMKAIELPISRWKIMVSGLIGSLFLLLLYRKFLKN